MRFTVHIFAQSRHKISLQSPSKISRNEKITDADLKSLEDIQKKLDYMIKGGSFEQSTKF